MYILTLVLFAFPSLLIAKAWNGVVKAQSASRTPSWRTYCLIAALVTGSCMIQKHMVGVGPLFMLRCDRIPVMLTCYRHFAYLSCTGVVA